MTVTFFVLLTIYINFELHKSLSCSFSSNVLPKPLNGHEMAYSESLNSVYIFGGGGPSTSIYKWDTSQSNGWFTEITEITPTAQFWSYPKNSVVIGDRVYFVGLWDGSSAADWDTIYVFDMNTDTFIDNSNLQKLPFPASGGCLATNTTHLLLVGGRLSGNDFLNKLQIYSISDNTWYSEDLTLTDIFKGWAYQSCEMVNNVLYAFGGSIDHPGGDTDKYYKYQWETGWKKLGTKSIKTRYSMSTYSSMTGKIYIIGGERDGPQRFNNIDIFDVAKEVVVDQAVMLQDLSGMEALIINDKLYIFGGIDVNWNRQDTVQVCDLPSTPSPTYGNLKIRNCDGVTADEYKAEVVNVPNGVDLDWVRMRDASTANSWLDGTYNPNTGCYEWTNGITPYTLPLDFKIKAEKISLRITTKDVINSWDAGDEGDMNNNFFAAKSQDELKTDPLNTSPHKSYDNDLFASISSPILIISTSIIILVGIIMVFIYCIKRNRDQKEKNNENKEENVNDSTVSAENNGEIKNNKDETKQNEMEIKVSTDTQTETVEDELN